MTKVCESAHFLNLLYDHKDYASFNNAFPIIMKNFHEQIGLETNSSLQDSNKSEISNLGTDVLNLKNMGQKL